MRTWIASRRLRRRISAYAQPTPRHVYLIGLYTHS